MTPNLAELKLQHADALCRIRRDAREQTGTPLNHLHGTNLTFSNGFLGSVLDERLDIDDTSPSAFLSQLRKRIEDSREAAIFTLRPASHHA